MTARTAILLIFLALAAAPPPGAFADPPESPPAQAPPKDILFRLSGGVLSGRITGYDQDAIRMEVEVLPGQPPGRIAVPHRDILRVEFAPDPDGDALLARRSPESFDAIESEWLKRRPALAIEGSNAGEFGLATATLLLDRGRAGDRERALQIFDLIEREDWSDLRKSSARGGRLKTMVLLGRATEAIEEARRIVSQTDDPAVLIESHHVLGEAAFAALKKLVEENPRWREDIFVRPDYFRLFNEALDHYLFAPLFHGSHEAPAARGLWSAAEVFAFNGDTAQQRRLAADITALYPSSPYAAQARALLTQTTPGADSQPE